jgi:hypothetical protein
LNEAGIAGKSPRQNAWNHETVFTGISEGSNSAGNDLRYLLWRNGTARLYAIGVPFMAAQIPRPNPQLSATQANAESKWAAGHATRFIFSRPLQLAHRAAASQDAAR